MRVFKKSRVRNDDIDVYIESLRQPTDGLLTETELLKYNIMSNVDPDDLQLLGPKPRPVINTLERMIAYERVLLRECRWRLPNFIGQQLNIKDSDKEWKEFCKREDPLYREEDFMKKATTLTQFLSWLKAQRW